MARLTERRTLYVAWAWAVNGFFSVIGSVLTTIHTMVYGFRVIQALGLAVYCAATLILPRLAASGDSDRQFTPG